MKKCVYLVCSLLLTACYSNEEEFSVIDANNQTDIEIDIDDFEFESDEPLTRTSIFDTDKHISVYWKEGDKIGVYSENALASFSTMEISKNARHATFDGGGFALTTDATYYAIYPYNGKKVNKNAITIDFSGQTQTVNNNTANLSNNDVMTSQTVATSPTAATFHFSHLASVLRMQFLAPQNEKYYSFTIKASDKIFIKSGTLNLADNDPTIDPETATYTDEVSLSFGNDGILPNPISLQIIAYLCVIPINASGCELQVSLKAANNKTYTTTIDGLNFVKGKAYKYECSFDINEVDYNIENSYVSKYMTQVSYDYSSYNYSAVFTYWKESYRGMRLDLPNSIHLGETFYTNLLPNQDYTLPYIYKGENKEAHVHTNGQLRMIHSEGIDNARDLGGWATSNGHHIRYGMLYRGSEMCTAQPKEKLVTSPHSITANDYNMFREQIGIKAELDLRSANEIPYKYRTRSVLGEDIDFLLDPIDYKLLDAKNKPALAKGLNFVIQSVKANKPIFYHCVWGADRTGLFSFLVEGLLGVSRSDIEKDYELTSFSDISRYRIYSVFRAYRDTINSYPGTNDQERFYNWWLSAGVASQDLDDFISLMVE